MDQSGLPGRPVTAGKCETCHRSGSGQKACQKLWLWGDACRGAVRAGIRFSPGRAGLSDAPVIMYLTMQRNPPLFGIFDIGAFPERLMPAVKECGAGGGLSVREVP